MSDLLQTIKDQVAQQVYKQNWNELEFTIEPILWPEVCKRYAFEVAKDALKNASAKVRFNHEWVDDEANHVLDLITEEINIKL